LLIHSPFLILSTERKWRQTIKIQF
jgi:hypothetical protein